MMIVRGSIRKTVGSSCISQKQPTVLNHLSNHQIIKSDQALVPSLSYATKENVNKPKGNARKKFNIKLSTNKAYETKEKREPAYLPKTDVELSEENFNLNKLRLAYYQTRKHIKKHDKWNHWIWDHMGMKKWNQRERTASLIEKNKKVRNETMALRDGIDKVLKKKLSSEETLLRSKIQMQNIQGGQSDFDGTMGMDDAMNSGWAEYYEYYEKLDNPASYSQRKKDTFDVYNSAFNLPIPKPKPFEKFQETINEWRQGKYINYEDYQKQFMEEVSELPMFSQKPKDPFAKQPHLIARISFKNPWELSKFISPSGQILGRRVTGVRMKTQKKIKTEINKARFLGLFSFTGNPYFSTTEEYQPTVDAENKDEIDKKPHLLRENESKLRVFLNSLQEDIAPNGSLKWEPNNTRGKYNQDDITIEKKGGLREQREERKKLLKELLMENMAMKGFSHFHNEERIKELESILEQREKKLNDAELAKTNEEGNRVDEVASMLVDENNYIEALSTLSKQQRNKIGRTLNEKQASKKKRESKRGTSDYFSNTSTTPFEQ